MGKFSGVLICTDYDGTLASGGKVVEKNKEAIKYFTDNGGMLSVITGRTIPFLEENKNEIGYNTFIAGVNGTVIYDISQEKMINESKSFPLIPNLRFKTIPHSPKGNDQRSVRTQAFTQKLDMGIQSSIVAVKIVAPNIGNQFFPTQSQISILYQIK